MIRVIPAIAIFLALLNPSALAQKVPTSASETCPIKTGMALPVLNLTDVAGEPFDVNLAVVKQPSILIFYRGSWCPYCNTHLGELKTVEDELKKMGYQIIAISPDLPENLAESVDKNDLRYRLLSDNKARAASALGLAFRVDDATYEKYIGYGIDLEKASGEKHRMLPIPAALVLDTEGTVRFAFTSPDYKTRVDTKVLLAAAESALK